MAKKKKQKQEKAKQVEPVTEEKQVKVVECPYCDEKDNTQCDCSVKFRNFTPEVIKLAKERGFSDEQIVTYTETASLNIACMNIKPFVERPKFRKREKGHMRVTGKPAKAEIISEITERRSENINRDSYDKQQYMSYMMRNHISQKDVKSININRSFVPDNGVLKTVIVIDYIKKG